jgi:hypothetical protein
MKNIIVGSMATVVAGSLVVAGASYAAPVVIEDFADGVGDPSFGIFGFAPNGAGQSQGLLGSSTSAVSATQWEFTPAGQDAYVNVLSIDDDAASSGGTNFGTPTAWTIRHFANGSPRNLTPAAGGNGFIGFYARTSDDDIAIRIALDENGGSGGTESSNLLEIEGDGEWNLYQVDLADASQWNATFGGNGVLDGTDYLIDSLLIYNTGANDGDTTTLDLAYVSYDSTGPLVNVIPEPTAALIGAGLGLPMLLRRRRSA